MRVIEIEMLYAIRNRSNWSKDNTAVSFDEYGFGSVYLFGNTIAKIDPFGNIQPVISTLEQYPTNTTKSRLRALGINVTQKNYELFIDNLPLHLC